MPIEESECHIQRILMLIAARMGNQQMSAACRIACYPPRPKTASYHVVWADGRDDARGLRDRVRRISTE